MNNFIISMFIILLVVFLGVVKEPSQRKIAQKVQEEFGETISEKQVGRIVKNRTFEQKCSKFSEKDEESIEPKPKTIDYSGGSPSKFFQLIFPFLK